MSIAFVVEFPLTDFLDSTQSKLKMESLSNFFLQCLSFFFLKKKKTLDMLENFDQIEIRITATLTQILTKTLASRQSISWQNVNAAAT
jgi:hypothetical protein